MITEKDLSEFRQALYSLKHYLQSADESGGPSPFASPCGIKT